MEQILSWEIDSFSFGQWMIRLWRDVYYCVYKSLTLNPTRARWLHSASSHLISSVTVFILLLSHKFLCLCSRLVPSTLLPKMLYVFLIYPTHTVLYAPVISSCLIWKPLKYLMTSVTYEASNFVFFGSFLLLSLCLRSRFATHYFVLNQFQSIFCL